eukprot:363670-Chlamydomonas_euryale.AAC.27
MEDLLETQRQLSERKQQLASLVSRACRTNACHAISACGGPSLFIYPDVWASGWVGSGVDKPRLPTLPKHLGLVGVLLASPAQVNTLKQEREGTEGIVAEMGAKTQQLRLWLDANEAKVDAVAGMGKEIDIAKAIVPVDALNEQVGAVLSAQPVLHEAFSREAVLEAGQMGVVDVAVAVFVDMVVVVVVVVVSRPARYQKRVVVSEAGRESKV